MLIPLQEKLFMDNWRYRRRWMSAALLWMAGNVQYLVLWGKDNALHQNLAITFLGAIVSILCFYIFGAVWDDSDKRSKLANTQDPALQQTPTTDTQPIGMSNVPIRSP